MTLLVNGISINLDYPYQNSNILTKKDSTEVSVWQKFVTEKGTYLLSQT